MSDADARERVTSTIPADAYHDPGIYDRERRAIFGRAWVPVGFAHSFSSTGDYLATTIAGWPIVIVRDGEGVLRGFHNVCRHRAGPLLDEGTGCTPALVCRYHAWSYDLDGDLRKARDFGAEVEPMPLFPVRVASWRGIVFVSLADDGPSLPDALGTFDEACPAFEIDALPDRRVLHADIDANWKAYADNYLEGYHIPIVHPQLSKQIDTSRYEVRVGRGWVEHVAPARDGSATSGVWLWRFPNLAVNVYPGGLNIEWFLPRGPRRTRVSNHYFFAVPDAPGNDDAMKLSAEVLDEDRGIVEAVQRNLMSGVYTAGPLSPKHEAGVAAFQGWVRDALARDV